MGIVLRKNELVKLNMNELELLREWWKPRKGDVVTDLTNEFGYFSNEKHETVNEDRMYSPNGKYMSFEDGFVSKLYPCPDLIMLTEFLRMRLNLENVNIDFSKEVTVTISSSNQQIKHKVSSNKITDVMIKMLNFIIKESYRQGYLVKEEPVTKDESTDKMDMFELE